MQEDCISNIKVFSAFLAYNILLHRKASQISHFQHITRGNKLQTSVWQNTEESILFQ